MSETYKALQTREEDGRYLTELVELARPPLEAGQVRVRVHCSSLNYKDAMSACGNRGVTREYPHVLGIDAAGEVIESNSANTSVGQKVIVTGYDLGMNADGGLSQELCCPGEWLVPVPEGMDFQGAMALGTAGLTAGLCVSRMISVIGDLKGKSILVSGSSGGVGSLAVVLLSQLGAEVTAVTGKKSQFDWLQSLGATHVMARAERRQLDTRPISKAIYHGAVDTVGGETLGNILKVIHRGGAVACCGMAGGTQFESSIFPFILRGISLLGVDSVEIPLADKAAVWQRFATDWRLSEQAVSNIVTDVSLTEGAAILGDFLKSSVVGRYRVNIG